MLLAALFSGGKDSTFALYKAMQQRHEIKVLVTISSENPESYMYHVPNIEITKLQSEAMGIPIMFRVTKGIKEEELEDLKKVLADAIKTYKIIGVVSGAIYSNYQKSRIERICSELGLNSLTPLWHQKPKALLTEMLTLGFKIIMTATAAGGLEENWLGRELDARAIEELSELHKTCYVCTGGEGGEFETLVLDAPFFNKKISVLDAEKIWHGQSGIYRIKKAVLVDKNSSFMV